MYVVILAANHVEANRHAKRHSLPRGRFRFATRASAIRGVRVAEVHYLPGFARRPDRFAIEAELRYAKGEKRFFDKFGREVDERGNRRLSYKTAYAVAYRLLDLTGLPAQEPSEQGGAPKTKPVQRVNETVDGPVEPPTPPEVFESPTVKRKKAPAKPPAKPPVKKTEAEPKFFE